VQPSRDDRDGITQVLPLRAFCPAPGIAMAAMRSQRSRCLLNSQPWREDAEAVRIGPIGFILDF
jgi:hypothetical protein